MLRPSQRLCLVLAASCAVGIFSSSSAQTYRWKDERGIIHYGDEVPPKYKDSARVEISREGVPLRKIDQALTPAQRAEQEAKRTADALEAEKRERVERIDRALMSKYANMRELRAAHQRELDLADEELSAFTARATDLSKTAFSLIELKRRSRDQKLELSRLSDDLAQVAELLDKKLAERVDKERRQRLERERFEALTGGGKKQ